MSFFKRFSDVLVGFCALMGGIELLRKYMNYSFTDEEMMLGFTDKVKLFLSPEAKGEPRHFALFVGLIMLYFLVSMIFFKLPALSAIIAPFPLLLSVVLFFDGILDNDDFFYILCLGVGLAGALYDSLRADRDKGRLLTHAAAGLVGVSFMNILLRIRSLSLFTTIVTDDPTKIDDAAKATIDKYELLGIDLRQVITPEQSDLMMLLAILVIVSVIVSFIFRGAYFIDLGFSAFLLIFTVIKWHADVLTHSEAPILGLAIVYFAFRIAIFFGEPVSKKKKEPTPDTIEQNS